MTFDPHTRKDHNLTKRTFGRLSFEGSVTLGRAELQYGRHLKVSTACLAQVRQPQALKRACRGLGPFKVNEALTVPLARSHLDQIVFKKMATVSVLYGEDPKIGIEF